MCRASLNKTVLVTDFDGVLLDSEPEVEVEEARTPVTTPTQLSASGIRAATTIWHDCLEQPDAATMQRVVHDTRECRSKLVNGFEAVIMARLLLQGPSGKAAILSDDPAWEQRWPMLLKEWGMSAPELAARFDAQRTHQATHHPDAWAASQVIYPGIQDALTTCAFPVYFASSKAAGRISMLLTRKFGLDVGPGSPRLYAGLLPPNERKLHALQYVVRVFVYTFSPVVSSYHSWFYYYFPCPFFFLLLLHAPSCLQHTCQRHDRTIAQLPECQGARLHFVDDRIETLHHMVDAPSVAPWRLYFASWGYSTPEEQQLARALAPRVQWLELDEYVEFLKAGTMRYVGTLGFVATDGDETLCAHVPIDRPDDCHEPATGATTP